MDESYEETDQERAYIMLARVERPINNAKVDIPLDDVKIQLGSKFVPRTSTIISYGAGRKSIRR